MKILLLMDPYIPVPPVHYGGIERVIYDIACQYVKMGHSVTIIAGPNSKSPDRLIEYGKNADIQEIKIDWRLSFKLLNILRREIKEHDVIHNFGRLFWMYLIFNSKIKKVQTYMRYISPRNIQILNKIGCRNITYTAVSDAIVKTGISGGGNWKTVYNCTPIEQFAFVPDVPSQAPLFFIGRLERCKGAHTAIKVAQITNRKLIIAGTISPIEKEISYFENELRPHFDGELIEFIGPIDNERKNKIFGSCAAMLLPVEWYEPFPIVLPESYACGTPILAFPGGGVPEGIIHGQTGFISTSAEEMASQVEEIEKLSRKKCRELAVELYSDFKIANDYLQIYSN
jgi:glycosyltransferase involved in cell wall biosynthesis